MYFSGGYYFEESRRKPLELFAFSDKKENGSSVPNYVVNPSTWWKLGLWDALVDRNNEGSEYINGPYNFSPDENNGSTFDFRSPEHLNQVLIENKIPNSDTELSLLHSFLKGRYKKRNEQYGNQKGLFSQDDLTRRNIIARKLCGLPYGDLEKSDQDEVDRVLNAGILIRNEETRKKRVTKIKDFEQRKRKEIEQRDGIIHILLPYE